MQQAKLRTSAATYKLMEPYTQRFLFSENLHNRNHSDWAKFIEKLVKNPNMAKDMGERLYETVKDKYDLNVVTKARAEFYKSIV